MLFAFVQEPFLLGVGQQDLGMLWRTQDVNAEALAGRGHEGAAMGGVLALGRVVPAGLPVNADARLPVLLDFHFIQHARQVLALGGDAAGRALVNGRLGCRQERGRHDQRQGGGQEYTAHGSSSSGRAGPR